MCCDSLLPLQPVIRTNYQNMNFFPHQFCGYLLSEEVGFTRYVKLGMPRSKTIGNTPRYDVMEAHGYGMRHKLMIVTFCN